MRKNGTDIQNRHKDGRIFQAFCICLYKMECKLHFGVYITSVYVIGSEKRGLMALTFDSQLTLPT